MSKFSLVMVAKKLEGAGFGRPAIAEVFGQDPSGISRILKGYDLEASFPRVVHIADKLQLSLEDVKRMGTDPDYMPPLGKATFRPASDQPALAGAAL